PDTSTLTGLTYCSRARPALPTFPTRRSSDLDLATANNNSGTGTNGASVLINTTAAGSGNPTFAGPASLATGTNPQSMAVGDLNDIGRADVATAVTSPSRRTSSARRHNTTTGD